MYKGLYISSFSIIKNEIKFPNVEFNFYICNTVIYMVIISKTILAEYGVVNADAADALNKWYEVAKKANWNNLNELKKTYSTVDYVGNDRYVFNIKGNKYRLVVMIFFNIRTMFIRFIGTHAEYNKINCSEI